MAEKLTHLDEHGHARMVDIAGKKGTRRIAIAQGFVRMKRSTLELITEGHAAKGDALGTARLAGIMAAKKTPGLIPLTHPIALTHASVDFELKKDGVLIAAKAECFGPTGVEMEAMTAVAIAALTIYDMCKAVDRGMVIESIYLVRKEGGKSGVYEARNKYKRKRK